MALGPAQTTSIGVRASSSRSDEMSSDGRRPSGSPVRPGSPRAPRWTPPIPPVAKTPMPAAAAAIIVADTVVAAQPPRASAAPRFGRAALTTAPGGAVAERHRGRRRDRPTRNRPSRMATVAGTAPASRTAASDARATAMLSGCGRPWLMSVDSSATTGRPAASAAATSGGEGQTLGDGHRPMVRQPSWSSRRGAATWRAAIRLPATAARRRATQRRPADRPGREPFGDEPGIECVAGAGRVDRRQRSRRDVELDRRAVDPAATGVVPGEDGDPGRAALDDHDRREPHRPGIGPAAGAEQGVELRSRSRTADRGPPSGPGRGPQPGRRPGAVPTTRGPG